MELSVFQKIAIFTLPVLFAITVHEYAHGWAASRLGDNTARMAGRLTLNPIKHIDLVGTIIIPIVLLLLGGFLFGWAKPVPVDARNLRSPRGDMAWVAIAGPFSNLIMAFLWSLLLPLGKIVFNISSDVGLLMIYMAQAGVLINLALMLLNLIPIPPLDGSRILSAFLPLRLSYQYNRLEQYGFIFLIILLAFGWLGNIIGPPLYYLQNIFL